MTIPEILAAAIRRGASDVHLLSDMKPAYRVNGYIESAPRPPISAEALGAMLDAVLSEDQRRRFAETRELCFSMKLDGLGFFRFNLATHLGRPEAAIRIGHRELPEYDDLGLPETLLECARRTHGLVLVTGPTGVGKTTTLNAIIHRINRADRKKIVTIEDPVEFVHEPLQSLVVQREVGLDTPGFHQAVIHALRQDPDIIIIGEMRDQETIAAALTAAETGHLVLATLHTNGAAGTVSRIIDVFPAQQQAQIRLQLATTLQAVITQKLLPRADGSGRVMVYELLVMNAAARNLIRDGRTNQLPNIIQTGATLGMRSMDPMIREAYEAGEITWDTACSSVMDPRVLKR